MPLITGDRRTGTVIGSSTAALLIGVALAPGALRVVSLLGRGGVGVPNGVRITGDADVTAVADVRPLADVTLADVRVLADLGAVDVGSPAVLGGGVLQVGDLSVRVVRSWRSGVPRIDPAPDGVRELTDATARHPVGVPAEPVRRLAAALATAGTASPDTGPDELQDAIAALVGLGAGATPGGDDVLAGLLVGLLSTGRTALADRVSCDALHLVSERTTWLSADLLRLAAAGHACQEMLALLRVLHRPSRALPGGGAVVPHHPWDRELATLLSIGHTSGADLATGLALGLQEVR